jgi:hypothetical protein
MNVIRIVGQQGAGKSQSLQSIRLAGWMIGGESVYPSQTPIFTVHQSRLNDVGNMIDRTGQQPKVVMLDVECELSPKAQQHLIQIAESRGVQQLFLAYLG